MTNLAGGNQVGDSLTVLWNEGNDTRVGYGHVAAEVPFAIVLEGDAFPGEMAELRLVRDQGERWVSGSASVVDADGSLFMLRRVQWEEPSQRVHDRREVEWPATLRILDDRGTRETYKVGLTTDVSLGGAAVRLDEPPEVGSLVEIRAMPNDDKPLRAVAVVVRRSHEGIGLAFIYLWGAAHIEPPVQQVYLRAA